eukprot:gnl/TRDRNA2_/TRDRNA2_38685_c0_seq1.p1 gnl/TRDRNA2_/TRDRNA2_38685_c0~~gnl/TRDRNA2_/TRDRNA2_38685_c0_seq1.p1  ORF type:complete len:470 (+),score=59.58 gnl/TRDRNA2_/TRDRNA2_38685_c0_seq1:51-1460(+)
MRTIGVIILFACDAKARAGELARHPGQLQDCIERLAEASQDGIEDPLWLHSYIRRFDSLHDGIEETTMLGMPGHLAMPSTALISPKPRLPLRPFRYGGSASSAASYTCPNNKAWLLHEDVTGHRVHGVGSRQVRGSAESPVQSMSSANQSQFDDEIAKYDAMVEKEKAAGRLAATEMSVSRAFTVDLPKAKGAAEGRTLLDYVRLPAQQYNVLDSDRVKRVGPGTFQVTVGKQRLLWLEIEPVLMLRLAIFANGVEQCLIRTEIKSGKDGRSSGPIRALNDFLQNLQLTNRLTAVTGPDGQPQIRCQVDVCGAFAGPGAGSVRDLLKWSLGGVIPWFLTQLADDYGDWSEGKPRKSKKVDIATVAQEVMSGTRGNLPAGVAEVESMVLESLPAGDPAEFAAPQSTPLPEVAKAPEKEKRGFGLSEQTFSDSMVIFAAVGIGFFAIVVATFGSCRRGTSAGDEPLLVVGS